MIFDLETNLLNDTRSGDEGDVFYTAGNVLIMTAVVVDVQFINCHYCLDMSC